MKKILWQQTFPASDWKTFKVLYTVPATFETKADVFICNIMEHEDNWRYRLYLIPSWWDLANPTDEQAIWYYNKLSSWWTETIKWISMNEWDSLVCYGSHWQITFNVTWEEFKYNNDDFYNILYTLNITLNTRREASHLDLDAIRKAIHDHQTQYTCSCW